MPPEIDRKELKPSLSESDVSAGWKDMPLTPSSCRWPGAARPFSGHGKGVGEERKTWETTASPNGNSQPHVDFVNSWEQLNSGGGEKRPLEKGNSLGSSGLDWKPVKWIRSGSLSSRGSGFSHSNSFENKMDGQLGSGGGGGSFLQPPVGEAAACVTPNTPDDASSRKKARLGWGEGLAKYEKKKVDPEDVVDKEAGVSSSEPLLPSPSNVSAKSPSLTGFSECASPTTPCSFACSSSPGVDEKASVKAAAVDNDVCNPSVSSCHLSDNHTEEPTFNLENLELTEAVNLSSALNELLQSDDTSASTSGFVRSTAMDKLHVWKADISRTLEITESEIDSLENELKSLIPDVRGSCPSPAATCSLPTDSSGKNTEENSGPTERADDCVEVLEKHNRVEDLDRESPGTATSKFVESVVLCNSSMNSETVELRDSSVNLDIIPDKAECSQDHGGDNMLGVATGSSYTTSVVTVRFVELRELNDCLSASNKATAKSTSEELSKLLPTTSHCARICRDTNVSVLKKNFTMRKRFLKFKERVITFKFRAFQHSWKEDLRLLALKKCASKSHKKFEHTDHQKRHSRLTYPDGSFSMVSTTEIVEYMNKLLPDSQVKTYRNELKMPSLILDNRERMSSRFISDNGLVEDPIGIEKEKSVVNAWSAEEKEIFLNKYSLFGKNFKKISSFLQRRSIADCVEFYYKNHKSDLFQKIKKKSKFAKGSSSTTTNTYLVTSGKRLSQATSLDMLGAASAMVANVGTSSGDGDRLNDFANLCNEQETAAADVLAGICGSISPEALGSCITSSVDNGDIRHQVRTCQKLGGYLLQNVGEDDSCSDDSCGEEMESCNWTDEEKSNFIKGLKMYGKNFSMVSQCVRTKTSNQCKVYYSKARNLLGLDVTKFEPGSEGTTGANHGGGSDDHEGTCMVDSGSVISHDKSSMDCKMEPQSSELGEEHSESDLNVVNKEPEPLVSDTKSEDELVGERGSNGNLEGAADSEATEAANLEISPQNTCSDSASGAKVEESEHQLANGSSCNGNAIEDLNSTSLYSRGRSLDLTLDRGNGMDLNASLENMSTQEPVNGLVASNLFPQDPSVIPKRRTVSQDDVSSRLSFRKSSQRCSSTDGYHLHLPKHSLLDCAESSQILRGCTVTVSNNKGINGSSSYSKTQCNFKLDESLLMPTDDSLQMCNERRRSSSSDVEKPSGNGDVKLFGQILTNTSSNKLQPQPVLKANGSAQESEKPNGVKSYNLKFDHHRKLASLDLTRRNDYSSGVENNLQMSSHGFWDGNRIQTGFPSLPDSAVLLAKYPAAFTPFSAASKLDQDQQLHSLKRGNNLNVVSGFQPRKLSSNNGVANYNVFGSNEVLQPFTVDKKLLPGMPRSKELEVMSGVQQGIGIMGMNVNVVGGACNGVSDPVAAIRMHYAKTQQFTNGGGESWRSTGSDIGSR